MRGSSVAGCTTRGWRTITFTPRTRPTSTRNGGRSGRGRSGSYYSLADGCGVALVASISPTGVVAEAVDHLGGLDGLVHAAGVVAFGPGVEADDELLDELFLADTLGPIRLLRAAVPQIATGGFAVVVSAVVFQIVVARVVDAHGGGDGGSGDRCGRRRPRGGRA